jgi:hypothetical protein
MRSVAAATATLVLTCGAASFARAQTPASATVLVPRLITITGTCQDAHKTANDELTKRVAEPERSIKEVRFSGGSD